MLPSSSRINSTEYRDEPQLSLLFDIPFSTPQSQSNRDYKSVSASSSASAYSPPLESSTHSGASSPYLISNNYEVSTRLSSDIRRPCIDDERGPTPRVRRTGAAIIPFNTPDRPRYTGGFLAIPGLGGAPGPRLRPASWDSPSRVDGTLESPRLTRSRSSDDFRGDSGDEDLPFGRRTLPPLPVPSDSWRSDFHTTPTASSTPSRDLSPDSGNLSATNSVLSTSFHTSYSDGGYRSAPDQPEASTSANRFPSIPIPLPHSKSYPSDFESRPRRGRAKKPRPIPVPRVSQRAASQGTRRRRDNLPEPEEVDVIECGWTGCDSRIQYDARSVKDHIRFHHGGLLRSKVLQTCRWIRKDTMEECGSRLLSESLCRHTLDVHTNLIMKDCVCGKRFRRDTFGRHRCIAQGNL